MIQHSQSTDPVTVVTHHFEDENYNEMAILEESWRDDMEYRPEWRLIDPEPNDLTSLQMLCKELDVPFGTVETPSLIVEKLKKMVIGGDDEHDA